MGAAENSGKLGAFLRRRRGAIDRNSACVGTLTRLPQRIGRPVTQEELAGFLGISREWYSLLENGSIGTVSKQLVDGISRLFSIPHAALYALCDKSGLEIAAAEAFSEVRSFIKTVSGAASFVEGAALATDALQRVVNADCATISTVRTGDGRLVGYATGPQSKYWTALSDETAMEAHDSLRTGGIGVSRNVPQADEVERMVINYFELQGDAAGEYSYECTAQRWRAVNEGLKARSAVVVPLFEMNEYRGILATCWMEPDVPSDVHAAVAETLRSALRLASLPAISKAAAIDL